MTASAESPGDTPAGPTPAPRRHGDVLVQDIGGLDLELGGRLDDVHVAYETWGELDEDRANAVLVLHALTGDSHVAGTTGPGHPTPGWWDGVVGPGLAIDTDRWFVVAPNVLGGCRGTTGPATTGPDGYPFGSRFPRITVGDTVRAERVWADRLGLDGFAAVIGGSMGGMRALEWLAQEPDRIGAGVVLATSARSSADQIAVQSIQIRAVLDDPAWAGGDYSRSGGARPVHGLSLARRLAHVTYRSPVEFETRFGAAPQDGEDPLAGPALGRGQRYAIESYLDHQAEKLVGRFDAGSYVALTDALNTWDLGRGRGGVERALAGITAPVTVVGIDSDRLYPVDQQRFIADHLPRATFEEVHSPYGHDGFLVEREAVGAAIGRTLGAAPRGGSRAPRPVVVHRSEDVAH